MIKTSRSNRSPRSLIDEAQLRRISQDAHGVGLSAASEFGGSAPRTAVDFAVTLPGVQWQFDS